MTTHRPEDHILDPVGTDPGAEQTIHRDRDDGDGDRQLN
jgi:hypothetical protein